MGYSTSLYAIDLVALRAAIGSNDQALLSRAQAAAACQTHGPAAIDPTQGPRIKVTRDSQILLNGKLVTPSSYGYGLQCLCQVLGVKLGVIPGKGRLKALKVDTPLAEPRSPIALPEVDDFPQLSYLSAEEVAQEARRLEAMDLAYPKSSAIEEDRRTLLQYLQAAECEGHAVVSFYF